MVHGILFLPVMSSFPLFDLATLIPPTVKDLARRLTEWREKLGLENPGTVEGIHKEVQNDVFLTKYAFSGMKADLGKSFCQNPLFQVQHSFSAGSSQVAPWSFLSMYATDNVCPLLREEWFLIWVRYFCKGIWIMIYS